MSHGLVMIAHKTPLLPPRIWSQGWHSTNWEETPPHVSMSQLGSVFIVSSTVRYQSMFCLTPCALSGHTRHLLTLVSPRKNRWLIIHYWYGIWDPIQILHVIVCLRALLKYSSIPVWLRVAPIHQMGISVSFKTSTLNLDPDKLKFRKRKLATQCDETSTRNLLVSPNTYLRYTPYTYTFRPSVRLPFESIFYRGEGRPSGTSETRIRREVSETQLVLLSRRVSWPLGLKSRWQSDRTRPGPGATKSVGSEGPSVESPFIGLGQGLEEWSPLRDDRGERGWLRV